MFVKSIDNKKTYNDINGIEVKDIGESFLDPEGHKTSLYGIYKVPKDMEMRPDKVAISAYGTDEYTEMVCAYNEIKNPFTIEENDVVYMISLNNIYDNVYEPSEDAATLKNTNGYEIFRNFIDKTRLPNTVGSQKNNSIIAKSTKYVKSSVAKNLFNTNDILGNAINSTSANTGNVITPPNVAGANVAAVEVKNDKLIYGANNDNYSLGSVGAGNGNGNKSNKIKSENSNKAISTKGNVTNTTSSKFSVSTPSSTPITNLSNLNSVEDIVNYANSILNGALNSSSSASSTTTNSTENAINNAVQDAIKKLQENVSEEKEKVEQPTLENGVMNFGDDSSVACAQDGMSLGDYMTNRIKNEIK